MRSCSSNMFSDGVSAANQLVRATLAHHTLLSNMFWSEKCHLQYSRIHNVQRKTVHVLQLTRISIQEHKQRDTRNLSNLTKQLDN